MTQIELPLILLRTAYSNTVSYAWVRADGPMPMDRRSTADSPCSWLPSSPAQLPARGLYGLEGERTDPTDILVMIGFRRPIMYAIPRPTDSNIVRQPPSPTKVNPPRNIHPPFRTSTRPIHSRGDMSTAGEQSGMSALEMVRAAQARRLILLEPPAVLGPPSSSCSAPEQQQEEEELPPVEPLFDDVEAPQFIHPSQARAPAYVLSDSDEEEQDDGRGCTFAEDSGRLTYEEDREDQHRQESAGVCDIEDIASAVADNVFDAPRPPSPWHTTPSYVQPEMMGGDGYDFAGGTILDDGTIVGGTLGAASADSPLPRPNQAVVSHVTSLGFSVNCAKRAALATGNGDAVAAAHWAVSHVHVSGIDAPLHWSLDAHSGWVVSDVTVDQRTPSPDPRSVEEFGDDSGGMTAAAVRSYHTRGYDESYAVENSSESESDDDESDSNDSESQRDGRGSTSNDTSDCSGRSLRNQECDEAFELDEASSDEESERVRDEAAQQPHSSGDGPRGDDSAAAARNAGRSPAYIRIREQLQAKRAALGVSKHVCYSAAALDSLQRPGTVTVEG